jgi:hypothetical protein
MRYKLLIGLLFAAGSTFAQEGETKVFTVPCSEFAITESLIDIEAVAGTGVGDANKEINPIRQRHAMTHLQKEFEADRAVQTTAPYRAAADIVQNFNGIQDNEAGGYTPPDVSGAVGPNHYVQMVNVAMEIYDLEGNSLWGPTVLSQIFPSANNAGDPIVLYDEAADRWFISQFQFDNTIRVGISQTPDPTGAWYWYSYQFPSFPDYPKYSVWSDGYYVSSNMGGTNSAVFEREKMLAGDASAQAVLLQTPNQGSSGFRTALPVDLEGTDDPNRPAMIINCNDDGWGSQTGDHLRIWEFDVDWDTPGNSTLEELITLDVEDFDAVFPGFGFNNIDQPGSENSLDAIGDGLMFPAKFRDFGSHQSLVVCHSVQVDANGRAGVRWYELRDEGSGWSVYQTGTYAPGSDDASRWMGSIGIDAAGNISIAYSVSSTTIYPSLRFTGRYASDPLGDMTLAECVIEDGVGTQNGNRWGDYAQMTVDPVDGFTFWFSGEYTRNTGGSWGTKIAAWQLQTPAAIDLGALEIVEPNSGNLTATEEITITIRNFGLEEQSNFDVSYQIDGGAVVTETYPGTLAVGQEADYTFTATADLSAFGPYEILAYTSIDGDGWEPNDDVTKTVIHYFLQDVGVVSLVAPITQSQSTATETVTVEIMNFGANPASNFPITMEFNGGAAIQETVTGTVNSQETITYTFTATVDMEEVGEYDFYFYTSLTDDGDATNDPYAALVENLTPVYCAGESNCADFNDAILNVTLNNIDNDSGCSDGSYADYTSISTDIAQGGTYTLSSIVGYDDHFVTMWIDLDDSFGFTADEKFVDAMSCATAGTAGTESVTFPLDLTLGMHRMRVRTTYDDNSALDPCADQEWGETEDYMVNVVEPLPDNIARIDDTFALNVTQNSDASELQIMVSGFDGMYRVRLIDATGRLIRSAQFVANGYHTERMDTHTLVQGTYLVVVTSDIFRQTKKVIIAR